MTSHYYISLSVHTFILYLCLHVSYAEISGSRISIGEVDSEKHTGYLKIITCERTSILKGSSIIFALGIQLLTFIFVFNRTVWLGLR